MLHRPSGILHDPRLSDPGGPEAGSAAGSAEPETETKTASQPSAIQARTVEERSAPIATSRARSRRPGARHDSTHGPGEWIHEQSYDIVEGGTWVERRTYDWKLVPAEMLADHGAIVDIRTVTMSLSCAKNSLKSTSVLLAACVLLTPGCEEGQEVVVLRHFDEDP